VTTLTAYTDAHRQVFDEIGQVLASLDEDGLAIQSLCPDWDLRACLAHAVGIDKVMTGWGPDPDNLFDFAAVGSFMKEMAGVDRDTFVETLTQICADRLTDLEGRDPSVVDEPCLTPVGPQTFGAMLEIRVFDLWVHARDASLPAGLTLSDSGVAAEMALNQVHRSMGFIAGKKIGLADGMSMTVNVTGGAARTFHVNVDGRAQLVDELANPDVTLTADTETLLMLACGRVDPQERIDAGRITWSGDASWGERAARNLRFTM
jgi:uncharacterized protein (TIGR03083 family)